MPKRSSVDMLPEEIRAELNRRLISGGFSGYEALAEWLGERGCEISKSSLHRHGQRLEKRLAAIRIATEQARAIAEAAGDDEGVMNDALIRLVQEKTFQALVEMEDAGEIALHKVGRMIADLSRSSIAQKRWMAETREKAKAASDEVVTLARRSGLSEEKAEEIRRKILGIV